MPAAKTKKRIGAVAQGESFWPEAVVRFLFLKSSTQMQKKKKRNAA